jgi:signal peptidase I
VIGAILLVAVPACLVLAFVGAALWLRRRYTVIDIVGASMEPSYRSGDRVLVRRTPCAKVLGGQVVVFERDYGDAEPAGDPAASVQQRPVGAGPVGAGPVAARRPSWVGHPGRDRSWMLKRAAAVPGDPVPRDKVPALRDVPERVVPAGHLVVLGDNPAASLDSRQFGYVTRERLLGVAVRRLTTNPAGTATATRATPPPA